jgi:hypothetical protein
MANRGGPQGMGWRESAGLVKELLYFPHMVVNIEPKISCIGPLGYLWLVLTRMLFLFEKFMLNSSTRRGKRADRVARKAEFRGLGLYGEP